MKKKIYIACAAALMALAVALGCGPDLSAAFLSVAREILSAPESSLLTSLKKLRKEPPAQHGVKPTKDWPAMLPTTLEVDVADLHRVLDTRGVPKSELDEIVKEYKKLRQEQLSLWDDGWEFLYPTARIPEESRNGNLHAWIAQPKQWPAVIPKEFRLYAEGVAKLHEKGAGWQAASDKWRELLALPLEDRRERSVWAAWMLAYNEIDYDKCREWYGKILQYVNAEGCSDTLRMAPVASYRQKNTAVQDLICAYHNVKANGRRQYQDDLSHSAARVIADKDQALEAARDPVTRDLVSLSLDGRDVEAWLGVLKSAGIKDDITMGHIGISAYLDGRYELAGKTLALAAATWETRWIQAKLALQKGDRDQAARWMADALRLIPQSSRSTVISITESRPSDYDMGLLHEGDFSGVSVAKLDTGLRHSRFFADCGAVLLSRADFAGALKLFMDAQCPHDAAYVAEHLMTADELITFLRKQSLQPIPEILPSGKENDVQNWSHEHDNRTENIQNRVLYVIARRLAREFYFNDARPYYPPAMLPYFDRFVSLYRRGQSDAVSREVRARCLMEAARLHRWMGMELFGAEGEPDGAMWDGDYSPDHLTLMRRSQFRGLEGEWDWTGEKSVWKEQKPKEPFPLRPSAEEISRMKKNMLWGRPRFHYRAVAVQMAREASNLLPRESEESAMMLAEGGCWVRPVEDGIDPMFEELISRFAKTKFAQEADARRWYPDEFRSRVFNWSAEASLKQPIPGDKSAD